MKIQAKIPIVSFHCPLLHKNLLVSHRLLGPFYHLNTLPALPPPCPRLIRAQPNALSQVEVATRIMFGGGAGPSAVAGDDGPTTAAKRNGRRETWCPGGRNAWAAPLVAGKARHVRF